MSSPTTVQDVTGKVFCLLSNEPFMFDPFQLRSIQEVTRHEPGTRQEYKATRLSWIDGTWNELTTPFDDIVEVVSKAWERINVDV